MPAVGSESNPLLPALCLLCLRPPLLGADPALGFLLDDVLPLLSCCVGLSHPVTSMASCQRDLLSCDCTVEVITSVVTARSES